jgi:hypothetical protein
MAGERRDFGGGQSLLERDRDERVAQVVQSDRLEPVPVQTRSLARLVEGAERVAARLRLAVPS